MLDFLGLGSAIGTELAQSFSREHLMKIVTVVSAGMDPRHSIEAIGRIFMSLTVVLVFLFLA